MSSQKQPKTVSERIAKLSSFEFVLKDIAMRAVYQGDYDEHYHREGIVNLSTSHNQAISDQITEKLNEPDLLKWDTTMLPYVERRGIPRVRKAVADFLSSLVKAPEALDPDKFHITNGVIAGLSVLPYILCDVGDSILTPCPVYGAIPRDFLFQSGVNIYPVHLSSKAEADGEPYELTVPLLETALEKAKEEGHTVKCLLLINPVNPFGTVYSREQVLNYLEFCKRHNLHCIIDEIYVASIFDESTENTSIFTFHPDDLPDKNKTHFLWGMSKDFGMPGCPVGVVYSWNQEVLDALSLMIDFYQIPVFIQVAVSKLLEDKEWLNSYLPSHNKMLLESSSIVMETLDELGLPYIKPKAGLFMWADFRKIIPNASKEREMKFAQHCLDYGLALAPGSAFYTNEFGWVRLVHALPKSKLIEGMRRLKLACTSFQELSSDGCQ